MNPFTAARREKFKCSLLCFRSYIEDAAFLIAIVGVFLTIMFFLFSHKQLDSNHHMPDEYFLVIVLSILAHLGIIVALISRLSAFCYPYLFLQAISILPIGYVFLSSGFIVVDTVTNWSDSIKLESRANGQWLPREYPVRFVALNAFVLLGLQLILQVWTFSIVWRAVKALDWEQVSNKLAKDQKQQQEQQPSASITIKSIA